MAPHQIRLIGDPVLRKPATEVTNVDGALVRLTDDMFATMYGAPGIGLAAPQVGVQKRFFVYDHGEGAGVILNPRIIESGGEWTFEEGCLSVPDLSWEITRPKQIHLVGVDLDGNEISIEADEIEARLFQHEIDHLDGILLVDHLDEDQQREARRALRERTMSRPASAGQFDGGLRL
ncbi:MAG: peptide deformylase [Acidimicrobiales bacterium]|nr:peptide deformylase [Acidimicrobiaceae bacterium]MBT5568774.1 peptide deformylase [Acidimicrobiaceae bacterium]MBT6091728.1 peptide deformylase [Acidimicrobiaceae bacterium]MDG2161550.1 peptide deformylase [Acidimicrobiales bacterium]